MAKQNGKNKVKNVVDAELVTTEPKPMQAVTPMHLLEKALSTDADIDKLAKLYDLQVKWEEDQARKEFNIAFAAFKAEGIEIVKDTHVAFDTSKGKTEYDHASLAGICDQIVEALSKHGLSHSWDADQSDKKVTVTCEITHSMGHSKKVTLSSDPDSSGGKNPIQAIASAVTYLSRYTLLLATGLAAKQLPDDDGQNACPEEVPYDVISDEQWAKLDTMISQSGDTMERFCKYYRVKDLCFLPADKFDHAVNLMDKKMKDNANE